MKRRTQQKPLTGGGGSGSSRAGGQKAKRACPDRATSASSSSSSQMGARGSKRKLTHSNNVIAPLGGSGSTTSTPAPQAATALWEWADDNGTYKAYDQQTIDAIEAAFAAGQTSTSVQLGSTSYTIDITNMRQTNDSTNFSRAIRRNAAFATGLNASLASSRSSLSLSGSSSSPPASTSTSPSGIVWEYEKEDGEWEAYDQMTTRLIEGSLSNGRTNVVLNHGAFAVPGGFMVDFVNLTQTKQSTKEAVRVRRNPAIVQSNYPALVKAAAAASSSSSTTTTTAKDDGKAFSDAGKGKLKEVGQLTKWARVTEKLLPEETCPVCLCEFESESHEEDDGKGKEPEGDEKETPDSKEEKKGEKKEKKNKKKKEKAIEDEEDDVIVRLSQCQGHYFHRDCIVHCYKSGFLQCPICNVVYGVRIGTMPPGTMNVSTYGPSLSGYENCGTIQIDYHFPSGTQGPEHPHPGVAYGGTSRTAYLPDNKEGQEILALFKIAWERKLLFTVGRSVTTGEDNQVVWGGIHHKTSTSGGPTSFGYPDPTYFERVKAELAAKGVVLES